MTRLRRYGVHRAIDAMVPTLLFAAGLLYDDPGVWYASFAFCFALLAGSVLLGATLTMLASRRVGVRIQGPRRHAAPVFREGLDTLLAMFVFAALLAWPLAQWRMGRPTGAVLDPADAGFALWQIVAITLLGVIVLDAWLYWKHRLLHTPLLFGFHRGHHAYRDPTPLAGFAVGPVEALLTFWPALLVAIPQVVHWVPLYFGLVVGFVVLNFYLHCGVTLAPVEAVLPRLLINTSAFHNVHHSHVRVNFGEAMILWDVLCGTRLGDRNDAIPAAEQAEGGGRADWVPGEQEGSIASRV